MIIPTSGRLVLQKIKQEENKSPTGLILPSSQPKQDKYTIVAVPAFFVASDMRLQEGDIVYIDKYKGVEITKDGETYLVIEEMDIVAYEN